MPRGGSRFAKGSPEAAARMAAAREARAAKAAPAPAVVVGTAVVFDRNKPFLAQRGLGGDQRVHRVEKRLPTDLVRTQLPPGPAERSANPMAGEIGAKLWLVLSTDSPNDSTDWP